MEFVDFLRPRNYSMGRSVGHALACVTLGVAALLIPATPSQAPVFDVLVFSKTNGFRHASIPHGVAAIQALGNEHGFRIESTEDAGAFTDANLARFDVVIFNNTNSADGPILNSAQRTAFERYIRTGRGYVGIHSAAGTEYDWPWYGQLMGAFFSDHPAIQQVTVQVDDRVHPSTRGFPQDWVRTEEPYNFQIDPRGSVHVLASYDERSYSGGTMRADHPISWCHEFEAGRSWYTGMGHNPSAFSEPLFLQHLLGGIQWAAGVVEGDCGATDEEHFEKALLDGDTDDPLDMDVDSRGRVFFVERGGAVKVHDPGRERTALAARLDVFVDHTHGMHGIVLDPGFDQNHFVYIYYSPSDDTVIRLSRFTFDEATRTLDPISEKVLLRVPSQRSVNAHEGGGMAFDPAGNLYLGTGDNTPPSDSAPIDERSGRAFSDAQRTSGNTDDLRGKILRIHPEPDGTYTIPPGNLFTPGMPNIRPEIYVMGVRQPYRVHVDSENGWLYWGDVGPDAHSDQAQLGPQGYDEWNQARAPGNYGWPYCIGPNLSYRDRNFTAGTSGPPFDCANGPTNDSPNNTGASALPPGRSAWIWYPYDGSAQFPELGWGGRVAIGGPTYHYEAELDSDVKLPPYYDDTVFVAEWVRNAIFEVKLDSQGRPSIINRFLPHTTFLRPIDLELGPDGSLYIMEWGSNYGGSGRNDPNLDSGIYKINYVRSGERCPVARASATPTSGQPPLAVSFSSAGTFDPDPGQQIRYAWDFTSDGTVDSIEASPIHTFTTRADVVTRLTVTDSTERFSVANVPLTVGNTAPVMEMIDPLDGQIFEFGDAVDVEVRVADAEDGSSEAGTIDCQRVVIQPSLGHGQHSHPLEQYLGCRVLVQTSSDGVHTENGDMFYVVDARYPDLGGIGASPLTGGDSAILQPRQKQAEHWTDAYGVALYGTGEPGGGRMVGQIGHGDWLSFEPVNLRGVTDLVFRVASAGSGGTIEVRIDSTTGPLVASARVHPTGGSYTFTTVTAPATDPGGSHELFFVFENNPGDGYLFNLDWVAFCDRLTRPPGDPDVDFDGDGIRDFCETGARLADADHSSRVDGFDLARLARAFGSTIGQAHFDSAVDLDRNGAIDGDDLAILAAYFGRLSG